MAQAFVQRRTSLTQEQWDKFLSRDAGASSHSLSALAGAYPVHSQKGEPRQQLTRECDILIT